MMTPVITVNQNPSDMSHLPTERNVISLESRNACTRSSKMLMGKTTTFPCHVISDPKAQGNVFFTTPNILMSVPARSARCTFSEFPGMAAKQHYAQVKTASLPQAKRDMTRCWVTCNPTHPSQRRSNALHHRPNVAVQTTSTLDPRIQRLLGLRIPDRP